MPEMTSDGWIDHPFFGRISIHDCKLDLSRPWHTGVDGDTIVAMQQDESGVLLAHFVKLDTKSKR